MNTKLDEDGQPLNLNYNYNRRITRAISELIGFLRGIVADQNVSPDECEQLAKWVLVNREVSDIWPVSAVVERLDRIYQDGIADEEERADLTELINHIIGNQDQETFLFGPTDLPLTNPEPDILFELKEFVFTGKFFYGPRKICEREIEARGGHCAGSVHLKTSYVVIGSLMSRDWKFTTHGTKIQKAVEYQRRAPIAIVSEKHWRAFLAG